MRAKRTTNTAARLVDSRWFQVSILIVIAVNAVLVGLETSSALVARYGALFRAANGLVLAVFVAEMVLRIASYGRRVGNFFKDGWNLFDLLVVTVSLAPGVGPFATVGRIARVLRVTRLVSATPKLRLIIGTMLRSIPSLGHVSLLLLLLLYVYGVIGVNLFSSHDAEHWGSLGRALLTLFQILTLEGWVEIQNVSAAATPWAWIYYASFVIVAVFVVVNLFIAVVLNNLDEIREEDRIAAAEAVARTADPDDPATALRRHLDVIRAELQRLESVERRLAAPSRVASSPQAASTRPG